MEGRLPIDEQLERFFRQPWRPIPLDRGNIPACCLPSEPQFITAVVFRGVHLAMVCTSRGFERKPRTRLGRIANRCEVGSWCLFAFGAAFLLELFYRTVAFVMEQKMRWISWLVILLLVIAPAWMLLSYPNYHNPLTALLLNVGLCWASIHVTIQESKRTADSHANRKWLPQAEGACDRLLTLKYALKTLQLQSKHRCDEMGNLLPELHDKKNHSLRALLQYQCIDTGHRIGEFANQLDSAVSDWRRFIREVCRDRECEIIFENLDRLIEKARARLCRL